MRPADLWTELATDTSTPDLRKWDLIVVYSSGGKDSQAALDESWRHASAAAVADRIVVVHNDLGRVEWPGTRDLAQQQAAHYGLRFVAVVKPGPDLLEDVRTRAGRDGRHRWPDAARRWCTSDHKRAPGRRLLTALVRELALPRPARVLQVYGFRAEESRSRARRAVYAPNEAASTKTTRHVWDWYPIHSWTTEQVWARIRESGVPYHPAYDAGMSRLSCSFCVLSSKADLLTAIKLRPDLAAEYAAVEEEIGHDFQPGRPLAVLIAEAGAR